MSKLLSLDSNLLIKIIESLTLKDVIRFASCCRQLQQLTFDSAEVWSSHLLFESHQNEIDDQVIANIVPRITRSYGIHSLHLIGLNNVSSIGILQTFDQFAHALKDIELCSSMEVIAALTRHLEAFSLKLAMLQAANSIPLTFMEYRCHYPEHMDQLRSYMSDSPSPEDAKNSVLNSHAELFARLRWLQLPTKLDDPPFEQLERIKVKISDASNDDGSKKGICTILKLRTLIAYLSGANLECDLDSDIQAQHSEAHVDRWFTITRKQKVEDLNSKLEMQPNITVAAQQQQTQPYRSVDTQKDVPSSVQDQVPSPGANLSLSTTPFDQQDTPTATTPSHDSHKRTFTQTEPRPSSEESKRPRRSSPTQPVVKVYRYRRRRSPNFEQHEQRQAPPAQQQQRPHVHRPYPVSN
ncbi:hypothetical protein Unana1_04001 [Umbelopsis nana]